MSDPQISVIDNVEQSRFEISVGTGLAGFAAYRIDADVITFFHTEIDPAFEGQGLASALAAASLDEVRARGLKVVPECPFYRTYMKRHTEYSDLLA